MRLPRSAIGLFTAALALSAPAIASPPSQAAANAAVVSYEAGPWRYQGVVSAPGLSGRLLLSFRDTDGRLAGEVLLLTPDRRLLAASAVVGRRHGQQCHVHMTLEDRSVGLDGICSPTTLGGRLVVDRPPGNPLFELLAWWDDRRTPGEAWLSAGGDL